jgi:twitching motility two-component system response regulator PilH
MKILVVDDSKMLQAGMKRALVSAGHEVILAGDGKEGLAAARRNLPDLILLDMMLPTMSGLEALSALKIEPSTKDIPIFVLTGLSQKNEKSYRAPGPRGTLRNHAASWNTTSPHSSRRWGIAVSNRLNISGIRRDCSDPLRIPGRDKTHRSPRSARPACLCLLDCNRRKQSSRTVLCSSR